MIPIHPVKTNDMIRQLLKQREKLVELLNQARYWIRYNSGVDEYDPETLTMLARIDMLLSKIKGASNE